VIQIKKKNKIPKEITFKAIQAKRKNREKFKSKINIVSNFYGTMNAYGIVDMNGSSDYLEAYGAYDASLPTITGGVHTHFGAYKIVE
jgi:hypothetical protein